MERTGQFKLRRKKIHLIISIIISIIWVLNGLICKVLNLVPRHEQIVKGILGEDNSRTITLLIGISEIIMAIWVMSRYKSRLNAIAQIIVVSLMNTLEFILVPDLLLWGKFNSFFALIFIGVVYYNEFVLNNNNLVKETKK